MKTLQRQAESLLVRHLEERRRDDDEVLTGGPFFYRGPEDFVLRHGRWYRPEDIYPADLPSLPPKLCYGNSIFLACKLGWRYVEGYAMLPRVLKVSPDNQDAICLPNPELGVVMPHAWCLDAEGKLRDATWTNGGLAYRGVEFSLERADDCAWNGDASVLLDSKRGWPLFRQEWKGEQFDLVWPASPRLEYLRSGRIPESHEELRVALEGVEA